MPFLALRYVGFLAGISFPLAAIRAQCPSGRALERQIATADAVVLGKVTLDRDCPPPTVDEVDRGLVHFECFGRQAHLTIQQTWRGPTKAGDVLYLNLPSDRPTPQMGKGETHVVFAKLGNLPRSSAWFGTTDSCMLPEGANSSEKDLRKQLDTWYKPHKS